MYARLSFALSPILFVHLFMWILRPKANERNVRVHTNIWKMLRKQIHLIIELLLQIMNELLK